MVGSFSILAVVCLGVAIVVVVFRLRARRGGGLPDYHLHMTIPLTELIKLNGKKVTEAFEKRWGFKVACAEVKSVSDPANNIRTFMIGNGTHTLLVQCNPNPLDPQFVNDHIPSWQKDLDATEKQTLLNHRARLIVEYTIGPRDNPVGRVLFTAKALDVLLSADQSVGLLNNITERYMSRKDARESFKEISRCDPANRSAQTLQIDNQILFLNLTVAHIVKNGSSDVWMHTHGMEQFALPNLHMRFVDKSQTEYFRELIANGCVYQMMAGPVLKPGNTCELAGDGIIYKLRRVKSTPDHSNGAYGALEIIPQ